jgi:hypothetical protein
MKSPLKIARTAMTPLAESLFGEEAVIARRLKHKKRERYSDDGRQELSSRFLAASRSFLHERFGGYSDVTWHRMYAAANGIEDHRYIPEEVFYARLEPRLNGGGAQPSQPDKLTQLLMLPKSLYPTLVGCVWRGHVFLGDDSETDVAGLVRACRDDWERVAVKLPDGAGGRGFQILETKGPELAKVLEGALAAGESLLVQEVLKQHEDVARLNPSSVNTLRIMTLRFNRQLHVLSSTVRFGRAGSVIDNQTRGGMSCGLDAEGVMNRLAFDEAFRTLTAHPDSGLEFEGLRLAGFEKAVAFCLEQHERLLQYDIVSWDIVISPDLRPVLVEFNVVWQGLNIHQFNNGPVFGDLTDDVLDALRSASPPWCRGLTRFFVERL